jgi:hypothetical protein
MSDEPDSAPPELTSEQEATVRRLLAQARHEGPLPAEVGDRLDRVLADLAPSSPTRSAPVVDLAARRRRRNAGGLLVAAAAVIVGGFAIGQGLGGSGSDSDDDSGSAAADSSIVRNSPGAPGASDDAAGGARADSAAPEGAAAEPLRLTSDNLAQEVEHQLSKGSASAELDAGQAPLPSYAAGLGCAPAEPTAYGLGQLFAAFYDGVPAVLALRPPEGDTQEAQVLDCGTGAPLRSVTVPAP